MTKLEKAERLALHYAEQITELENKIADINHSLVEQMAKLEEENAELRAKYLRATDEGTSWATLKSLEQKNKQLEQQIEKLKADLKVK